MTPRSFHTPNVKWPQLPVTVKEEIVGQATFFVRMR